MAPCSMPLISIPYNFILAQMPLGPCPELRFSPLRIAPPHDGMKRCRPGWLPGKAQGPREMPSIMAAPLGDRRITPVATQHGTASERENSDAAGAACHVGVGNLDSLRSPRSRDEKMLPLLWLHQSVLARGRGVLAGKPSRGSKRFIPLRQLLVN